MTIQVCVCCCNSRKFDNHLQKWSEWQECYKHRKSIAEIATHTICDKCRKKYSIKQKAQVF